MVGGRKGVFAWTPFACMMRMRHELDFDLEPGRLAFQFTLESGSRISFTGKSAIREMPTLLLPVCLGSVYLAL